jgi:hypothetical protein
LKDRFRKINSQSTGANKNETYEITSTGKFVSKFEEYNESSGGHEAD